MAILLSSGNNKIASGLQQDQVYVLKGIEVAIQ